RQGRQVSPASATVFRLQQPDRAMTPDDTPDTGADAGDVLFAGRMSLAIEAAGIGTWEYDPQTGSLEWDARCRAVFGLPPEGGVSYSTSFLKGLHPDDRERAHAAVQAAL